MVGKCTDFQAKAERQMASWPCSVTLTVSWGPTVPITHSTKMGLANVQLVVNRNKKTRPCFTSVPSQLGFDKFGTHRLAIFSPIVFTLQAFNNMKCATIIFPP